MHAVIINGSPRTQKYSNTGKILGEIICGMEKTGSSYQLFSLSDRGQWYDARMAFARNENILIALPLYVESVPGLLMEFLETLVPKDRKTRISYILQSGFAEGVQLRCGEDYLERLTEHLGCSYGGTLVKGDNFMIRNLEGASLERKIYPYRRMGEIYGQRGDFFAVECTKFAGMEIYPLPLRMFLGFLFKTSFKKMMDSIAAEWGCREPLDARPYEVVR